MNAKSVIISLMFFTLFSCNENKNQPIIKKDVSLSFKSIRIGCPTDSIRYYLTQTETPEYAFFTDKYMLKEPSYLLRSDFTENKRSEKFQVEEKRVYAFPTYLITLKNEKIEGWCYIESTDNKVSRITFQLGTEDMWKFYSVKDLYIEKYGQWDYWHNNGTKKEENMGKPRDGDNEIGYVWEWNNQRIYIKGQYDEYWGKRNNIKYSVIYENILSEKEDIRKKDSIRTLEMKIELEKEKKEKNKNNELRIKQDI